MLVATALNRPPNRVNPIQRHHARLRGVDAFQAVAIELESWCLVENTDFLQTLREVIERAYPVLERLSVDFVRCRQQPLGERLIERLRAARIIGHRPVESLLEISAARIDARRRTGNASMQEFTDREPAPLAGRKASFDPPGFDQVNARIPEEVVQPAGILQRRFPGFSGRSISVQDFGFRQYIAIPNIQPVVRPVHVALEKADLPRHRLRQSRSTQVDHGGPRRFAGGPQLEREAVGIVPVRANRNGAAADEAKVEAGEGDGPEPGKIVSQERIDHPQYRCLADPVRAVEDSYALVDVEVDSVVVDSEQPFDIDALELQKLRLRHFRSPPCSGDTSRPCGEPGRSLRSRFSCPSADPARSHFPPFEVIRQSEARPVYA